MKNIFVIIVFVIVPLISFSQEPYVMVEEMPEYPGGDQAMYKFIAENIVYPFEAKENNIQGKVFISFVIDTVGKVTEVKIIRGVDPLLDAEAVRVVSLLPYWKPGKHEGKYVRVQLIIPINYQLSTGKEEKKNKK